MQLRPIIPLVLTAAVVTAGLGWYFYPRLLLHPRAVTKPLELTREVITPPPLRGSFNQPAGELSAAGVLAATNQQRAAHELQALSASAALNQAAQAKLNDMFRHQYFDHVGPDGREPADWVEGVGYQYIRVAENLALGNFASDAALVQAWMDSPGHRANILHRGLADIGLAVGHGDFEGRITWLAVQTFALPRTACPVPATALASAIAARKTQREDATKDLAARREQINQLTANLTAQADAMATLVKQANQKIEAGNTKIAEGNRIYRETGSREQAQPDWDEGQRLQAEGEALFDQAEAAQAAYNAAVSQLRTQQIEFNQDVATLEQTQRQLREAIATYNQQVEQFNACAA